MTEARATAWLSALAYPMIMTVITMDFMAPSMTAIGARMEISGTIPTGIIIGAAMTDIIFNARPAMDSTTSMDAESIAIISNMYWLNDSDTTNGGFIHAAGNDAKACRPLQTQKKPHRLNPAGLFLKQA
jgi:hypothetical protein